MSYTYTYLNVAKNLISGYAYPQPFHLYLKKYFAANKKHGSRDRKTIASLCYAYFRVGKNFDTLAVEDKLLLGFSLSQPELFVDAWQLLLAEKFSLLGTDFAALTIPQKIELLHTHYGFEVEKLFPYPQKLSALSNTTDFLTSILQQPLVWLRAKKNKKEKIEATLAHSQINYQLHPDAALAIGLAQQTNLEQVLGKNQHHLVEVQDASSQQTGGFITVNPLQKIWDCCCGAGGKALMLFDNEPKIELYCSDVRPQIIDNLKERFKLSGLPAPYTAILDIAHGAGTTVFETKSERKTAAKGYFDAILADVPCTGSGTWARTPEQAYYFSEEQIEDFVQKQKTIVANAISYLKKGGKLYYITCSVFEKENEAHLPYFESLGLKVEHYQNIEGYADQADTMFIAALVKA